jgi:hypothetical protein
MDSTSANRAAFKILEADEEVGPLVNLQCASHILSLLLNDMYKNIPWVKEVMDFALSVSATMNSSSLVLSLYQDFVIAQHRQPVMIPWHCETRFGSKLIVLRAVVESFNDLMYIMLFHHCVKTRLQHPVQQRS